MRVRSVAAILASLAIGFSIQSQSAKAVTGLPIQTDLGITEPGDVHLIYGTDMNITWTTDPTAHTGTIDAHGTDGVYLFPDFTQLDNPVYDVQATIDLDTNTVIGGSLLISGTPEPAPTIVTVPPTVYFYSTSILGFSYNPDNTEFQFLFTQQNQPPTDTSYAAIGQAVGVFVDYSSVDSGSATPADTLSFDNGGGTSKAFGQPVPEPMTMLLSGLGLGAAAIGAIRRRRA